MSLIIRVGWDPARLGYSFSVAEISGGFTRYVDLTSGEPHSSGTMARAGSVETLEQEAALVLAEDLWRTGARPKDATDREGEIFHLRSEVEYLRSLVNHLLPLPAKGMEST